LLPAPWQDSHPLWPAMAAPSMCSRLCVLAAKTRVILPWQSAQALLPTNDAPGTAGGNASVPPPLAHEFNMNATAQTNTRPAMNPIFFSSGGRMRTRGSLMG